MTTVHLVYPHGPSISCPDAIGRHLAKGLADRYEVRLYDWDANGKIPPGPDEVLLGHPHPSPFTIFRRSVKQDGWKRRIAMFPFNHADLGHIAFAAKSVSSCDLVLAITGNHWFRTVGTSQANSWAPKLRHLDLAVDRSEFPRIKSSFAEPGHRRFLYIGHSGWQKNVGYLSRIASLLPPGKVHWIGGGGPIRDVEALGAMDFGQARSLETVGSYDFMITVARADANPATVLESMSWGLIPICTKESGYEDVAGIVNIPLDDAEAAVSKLTELDLADSDRLLALRNANDEELDRHFNWPRFTAEVIAAIEGSESPPLGSRTAWEKLRWRGASVTSPYSIARPGNLVRYVGKGLRRGA